MVARAPTRAGRGRHGRNAGEMVGREEQNEEEEEEADDDDDKRASAGAARQQNGLAREGTAP